MSENSLVTIAPTTPTGLSVVEQGGLGLRKSFLFDLKPATLSIVQPNSTAEGALKGHLRISETGDQFKTMRVTLLDTPVEKRAFYVGEAGALNRTPENLHCFCNDVIRDDARRELSGPSDKAKYPQAQLCRTCPKGSWEQYRNAKEKGAGPQQLKDLIPPCDAYYYMALIDTEYQMPLQCFIRSKSKDPFEKGMKNLARKLAMLQAKKKKIPNIFDVSFTLSTTLIQSGKFPSYVINMSDFQGVSDEEREAFGEVFAAYASQKEAFQNRVAEPLEDEAPQIQETIDNIVQEGEYVDTTTGDVVL